MTSVAEQSPLCVAAVMPAELPRRLRNRDGVLLVALGDWRSRADDLVPRDAAGLIVTGTCGALAPAVAVGTLVAPEELQARDGSILRPDAGLRSGIVAAARRLGLDVRGGRIAEVARVVDSTEAREAVRRESGADLADMESASLAARAQARAIPWVVLRTVSDTAEQPLAWLEDLLGGLGPEQPSGLRVAAALVRRPWHAGRLVRLARTVGRGSDAVGRVVEAWLDGPGRG